MQRQPSATHDDRDGGFPTVTAGLLFLILAAFFLRVHLLGYQELRGDEAFSYGLVRKGLPHALKRVLDTGEPSTPLHVATLVASLDLWGASEFALRYASLLAAVTCVPVAFTLGRRLVNRAAGLWAAACMAASPIMVWYGQDARNMYPLMVLFTSLASVCLWQALASPRRAGRWWAGYTVAATLAVYSHWYAALALVAHALWVLLCARAHLRAYVLSALAAALLVAPWAWLHIPAILTRGPVGGGNPTPVLDLLGRTARALATGDFIGIRAWEAGAFWLVAIGLGLLGLRKAFKAEGETIRKDWVAVGVWLLLSVAIPFAIALSLAQRRTLYNEGYVLAALPPLVVLLGAAVTWKPVLRVAGAACVALMLLAVYNYQTDPRYSRTTGWRALSADLAADATAQDVLIVNEPDPTLYYYVRGPVQVLALPPTPESGPETIAQALEPVAARGGRIWFLPSPSTDPRRLVRAYLDSAWVPVQESWMVQKHVFVYAQPDWIRAHAQPAHVSFRAQGATLNLVAYYVVPRVTPGGTLRMVLVWTASGPAGVDYTVFTHLLDAGGNLIAGQDAPPAAGTRPTTSWQQGEIVLDAHAIEVPVDAPASLTLQVGLYDPATNARLNASAGGDTVQLIAVQVAAGN